MKIITWVLGLLTILYIGWIYWVFGCDIWDLTQNDKMGEAGDFIAGFTTPAVFIWLIYGYFLQWRELGLQRKELHETQRALGTQAAVMEGQIEVDRRRSMPIFRLEKDHSVQRDEDGVADEDGSTDPNAFVLRNLGGPARDLEIILMKGEYEESRKSEILLGTNQTFDLYVDNPFSSLSLAAPDSDGQPDDRPCYCTVSFTSDHGERFEQRWSIIFTGKYSYVEIRPTTEGPIPTAQP